MSRNSYVIASPNLSVDTNLTIPCYLIILEQKWIGDGNSNDIALAINVNAKTSQKP
jgi:hypothetical protein